MNIHVNAHNTKMLPPLDQRRALELRAYVCLIGQTLASAGEFLPGRAAANLLQKFHDTGVGTVTSDTEKVTLSLHGISASANGGAIGILQNWQNAATARLADS